MQDLICLYIDALSAQQQNYLSVPMNLLYMVKEEAKCQEKDI